ncbi:MAG TPA: GTPase HflX [Candidatus Saccharimonadales bacterium]|nr:GTPase HflX [Candidatus Saccharimonadales bacterium]
MSPRQLIDIAPPVERALLVGAPRKGSAEAGQVHEHLDELARLADTAGARVAGRVVQVVRRPAPDFYVGRGKVAEILGEVASLGATMVIFDEELSPAQGKNLEEELKVRIMDRTELILDIFALRAKSHEARMQVELAQLEYMLPRLARMWTHLSRIRGGIGLRGPGETQLETDRRMIRQKIGALKRKLGEVTDHRERVRARTRDRGVLRVALVGYTNAGKSSLLRALTGAEAHVEDRLFATLDTQSREVGLGVRGEGLGTARVRFTDTVGFIRKLPHGLVASFRATLEEALDADVVVHVVDVAHPDWLEQAQVVGEVLHEAGLDDGARVVVALNKVDRLTSNEAESRLGTARERGWEALLVSAAGGNGVRELRSGFAG